MFHTIKNILQYKKPTVISIDEGFSVYVIQRYLSFFLKPAELLVLNTYVNRNPEIYSDIQLFYDTVRTLFPRRNVIYKKYIKPRERVDNYNKNLCAEMCKHFQIKMTDLEEYLRINPNLVDDYEKRNTLYKK